LPSIHVTSHGPRAVVFSTKLIALTTPVDHLQPQNFQPATSFPMIPKFHGQSSPSQTDLPSRSLLSQRPATPLSSPTRDAIQSRTSIVCASVVAGLRATRWKPSELGQGPIFMFRPAAIPTTKCRRDMTAGARIRREQISGIRHGRCDMLHNFFSHILTWPWIFSFDVMSKYIPTDLGIDPLILILIFLQAC
jgi:hypothetical protein